MRMRLRRNYSAGRLIPTYFGGSCVLSCNPYRLKDPLRGRFFVPISHDEVAGSSERIQRQKKRLDIGVGLRRIACEKFIALAIEYTYTDSAACHADIRR